MRYYPPRPANSMRTILLLIVSATAILLVHSAAHSQDMPLQERIKIGTDAIKLGCGVQNTASKVDVQAAADGSITLKQLPSAAVNGQVHYTSRETVGLIAAFQQTISAEGARLSEKQLDCMKTYVDRIVNAVLPAAESEQAKSEKRQICLSTCDDGRNACKTNQQSEYNSCIEDRRQVCLRSCTHAYHLLMADCISNYCNTQVGSNKVDWPSKCSARQDASDCESQHVSCRNDCLAK
jgi:hypothetical protein